MKVMLAFVAVWAALGQSTDANTGKVEKTGEQNEAKETRANNKKMLKPISKNRSWLDAGNWTGLVLANILVFAALCASLFGVDKSVSSFTPLLEASGKEDVHGFIGPQLTQNTNLLDGSADMEPFTFDDDTLPTNNEAVKTSGWLLLGINAAIIGMAKILWTP